MISIRKETYPKKVIDHSKFTITDFNRFVIVNHKSKSNQNEESSIYYIQPGFNRKGGLYPRKLQIRGFTQWPLINGAGTTDGEPRMGSHTWPEMNSATLTIVDEEMVPLLLKYVKKLDEVNKENGIRAFVWDITDMY